MTTVFRVMGLLSACIALGAGAAMATEYFVAPTGDDAADGLTETTPFATVGRGVRDLQPGDVLTILPGEYNEAIGTRVSGRPDAPITIRARYPGSVVLRGDVDGPDFRPEPGMRYTWSAAFPERAEGVAERSTLKVYQYQPSIAEVESNNGSFYQDEQAGRLYVHTTDSRDPAGHALSVSVTSKHGLLLHGTKDKWASDVVIDGLSFTGYQVRDYPPGGPGSNIWLGLCIEYAERISVRRCSAFLNSGGIWLQLCRDAVVEQCYSFANRSYHYPLGKNILAWAVDNVTFRDNIVEGFMRDALTSEDDIAFYGGQALVGPFARRDGKVAMVGNIAVNAGIMIKGAFTADSEQSGNVAFGHGSYFYRKGGERDVLLGGRPEELLAQDYADPANRDFRLQSDSRLRGTGPDGSDPGPLPYRDQVFFVSPEGDDGAAGTSVRTAWRTLTHAAQAAQPGHTVYVLAGEYREALAPTRSGTAEQPIRFLRRGRDRVIIDGGQGVSTGIDLSGRSHIACSGFTIRSCTGAGVIAADGADLLLERLCVLDCAGDGIIGERTRDLQIRHSLVRGNGGYGIRLREVASGSVMANVVTGNALGGISYEGVSAGALWIDYNAYDPVQAHPVTLDGRAFDDLAAWQAGTGRDLHSIVEDPGLCDADNGDYSLLPGSPLIGRGPQAQAIGPCLRYTRTVPLIVEDVDIRPVTDTTATITYATPAYQQPGPSFWEAPGKRANGVSVEWGPATEYGSRLLLPSEWQTRHSVGLVGLEPGREYHYRVSSTASTDETVFVPFALDEATPPAAPEVTGTFRTLPASPAPKTFHVAVDGSDANTGLSADDTWRTIGHAGSEVHAGDTVLIHGGTYEEQVVVQATGDRDAPITFRAAPGETVWLSGSGRRRVIAFRLAGKHHIVLDGLHFREFNHQSHSDGCILITEGSNHTIRRCLHDGRVTRGYSGPLLRAHNCADLLLENSVFTLSMGEGLTTNECPGLAVRHCVFYNNQIRAASCFLEDAGGITTFSHTLFCDSGPGKTSVAILRLSDLANLRSDHNGYFTRVGRDERRVVEAAAVQGTAGTRILTLDEVQQLTSQETGSLFGNPGLRVTRELVPVGSPESEWRKVELGWDGQAYAPWTLTDFLPDPAGPFARSEAGRPIGLDPIAFD